MNSNLQNKLSQFEATPPGAVWDKIAQALDAEENFSTRLYHYEAQPKTKVWERIEILLGEGSPDKVIPFTTRFRRPIRYVAAASFIAIILVATTLMLKRTEAGSVQTGTNTTVPVKEATVHSPGTPALQSSSPTQPISSIYPGKENVTQTGRTQRQVPGFIKPQNIVSSIAFRGRFIPKEPDENQRFNFSSNNKYMVYNDGNGVAIKLSKKIFSLVHCEDGDISCKERIHFLQKKLASHTISADFGGVLEMLRQLQ